ncbi:hypothetical protein N566_04775 [Streptomycetaceae bacterium MP113-05]|nr:hypothetical protein N566_04775 [Streptomycetaceae bacterium MP113-05]
MAGVCLAPHARGADAVALTTGLLGRLAHRGPDGSGVLGSQGSALGMVRLRVRSAPGDSVPFTGGGADDVHAFNGEVYRCGAATPDGGLAEARAVAAGTECLDGMYALATTSADGSLRLTRDPLGIKPLYVRQVPEGVAVASETAPLLHLFGGPPRLRPEAFAQFLLTGRRVVDGGTFHEGVRPVAPGERLTLSAGRMSGSERPRTAPCGGEPAPAEIRAALEEAVERVLLTDRQVGLALSGGVDSTILAALLARRGIRDLPTVSVCPQNTSDGVRDLAGLGLPPEALDTWRHRWTPFRPDDLLDGLPAAVRAFGEPVAMTSIPMYAALAALARTSGITVLVVGEGADELFAGYNRYVPLFQGRYEDPQDFYASPEKLRLTRELVGPDAALAAHDALRDAVGRARETAGHRRGRIPTPVDVVREFELEHSLEPLLRRTDHLLMGEGIEGRTPFLHAGLPALAARCSPGALVRGSRTKAVMREAFGDLLPERYLDQRKQPFRAPLPQWLGGAALPRVDRSLAEATGELYARLGVLPSGVDLVRERLRRGDADVFGTAFALLSGAAWLREADTEPTGAVADVHR